MKFKTQSMINVKQSLLVIVIFCLVSINTSLAMSNNLNTNSATYSDGQLSKHQKNKYKKDATRLALRHLAGTKDFDQMDAEVPNELVESIYNSLIAVHQSGLPEAEVVTKDHKLHTFPIPTVDRVVVVYKRNAPWATPLRLGDDVTDSEDINALSEQYNLKINRHVEWDEEHNSFNMKAEKSFNMAPVAKDLSAIENIALVDMMEPNGDGNDIEIKKLSKGWEINYIIKFDGCITGCKKRHSWTFEVTDNGNVKFKNEQGDDLPKWMK